VTEKRSRLADVEEAMLLAGVARSDLECLHEIYRRHVGAVLDLAVRMGLDRQAAETAAAEVFVAIWDRPDEVVPHDVSLVDGLLEEARQACERQGGRVPLDEPVAPAANPSGLDPTRRPSLDDPRLDDDERQALELAIQGANYKQVAEVLGQPAEVVRRWLNSALQKLSE
jgi:hypothetical protein